MVKEITIKTTSGRWQYFIRTGWHDSQITCPVSTTTEKLFTSILARQHFCGKHVC